VIWRGLATRNVVIWRSLATRNEMIWRGLAVRNVHEEIRGAKVETGRADIAIRWLRVVGVGRLGVMMSWWRMRISSQHVVVDLLDLELVVVGDLLTGRPVEGPQLEDLQEEDTGHEVQLVVPAGRPQHQLEAVQVGGVLQLQGGAVKLQAGGQQEDGGLEGDEVALGQGSRYFIHQAHRVHKGENRLGRILDI